ncbi:MAG: glycosyltransferase [Akkermansiaceae bacterium]|nr:glycosyltransferase [Akkermansiaceae bacterium]
MDLFSGKFRADVAFHIERVAPWWKRKASRHFLIPNQERFPERLLPRLGMVDRVLCKSRHAEEIFSRHHADVRFIGFTSENRDLPDVEPDYGRFFHLAGRSTLKNTELLLELWRAHPEWPKLTLVQHPENAPRTVPRNVELVDRYMGDDELKILQNTCGIHLCPSFSEGWGHYIVESMSCAAVTVTTAAPPMDELVTPERGITVGVFRSEPRHLGMNFHVDPTELAAAVERLIAMPAGEKRMLGIAGREWFLENDKAFSGRLAAALV